MKGSRSAPGRPSTLWPRVAVLVAFGAGGGAGYVALTGLQEGWTALLYGLGGASGVALLIAVVLPSFQRGGSEGSKPLPGDIYEDREAPEPREAEPPELDGVPFSESKGVDASSRSGEGGELEARLEKLNKQLQRANVKLGLGELSQEGYSKIVEELKERRARVEAKLNGRAQARADEQSGKTPPGAG